MLPNIFLECVFSNYLRLTGAYNIIMLYDLFSFVSTSTDYCNYFYNCVYIKWFRPQYVLYAR